MSTAVKTLAKLPPGAVRHLIAIAEQPALRRLLVLR